MKQIKKEEKGGLDGPIYTDFELREIDNLDKEVSLKNFPSQNILVIEGMQGSGKTALYDSIIYGQIWKNDFDVILPVNLDYNDSNEMDVIKYADKRSNTSAENDIGMNIQEIPKKEKVLYAIDDFDKLKESKVKGILEKINNKEIINLLIFTTTLIPQFSSQKRVKLIGLKSMENFISSYFKDLSSLSQKLKKFLSQYSDISVLAKNPFYLKQMCNLLETEKEMTMGEMYKKVLKIIFGNPSQLKLNKHSRRLLKDISSEMYNNGQTNKISYKEIEKFQQKEKMEFSAEQIVQHLVGLGILELKGEDYSFVHEDILDYYYSYEKLASIENLTKEKPSFSNVDLFLCHRLRRDPKKLFQFFNTLFREQFEGSVERKNEVCLFLNEIRYDENKEELQQAIKNLERLGCQIFVDACRDSDYKIFKLFDLSLIKDESVVDHCLKVSTNSDKRIVRTLLKLKKSFSTKRSDTLQVSQIRGMITKLKEKLKIDVHSLFSSKGLEFENTVPTDFTEEENTDNKETLVTEPPYFSWEPYTLKFLELKPSDNNPMEKDIFGKSLIYYLSQKNGLEAIRYIYKTFGLRIVEEDSFQEACKHHYLELVKFFIGVIEENGNRVDEIIGQSKIIAFKNQEIISLLIEKIYKKSKEGMLELLLEAIKLNKKILIMELIKKGASVSSFLKGEPIFFQLFRNKKTNYNILQKFEMLNLNFNLKNIDGENCLHLSCIKEDIYLINHLISYGVLINEIDEEGFRPLDHIKSIKIISKLMKLGFKPNKDSNSFLLKKVVKHNPNLTQRTSKTVDVEQEDETETETEKEKEKVLQKEINVVSSLLDCLDPSKYKHILKIFVDLSIKGFLVKILVEKALKHNDQFLNNKTVFDKLFTENYKNIFLEMSIIEPKVFVHSFKAFYLTDNIQYFKEILQFDETKVARMVYLLPYEQKVYLEKIGEVIKEENKELEKSFQNNFDVVIDDYSALKKDVNRKDKPTKNIIFIDSHGISTKSKLVNKWIAKLIEKIKETEIKSYITFEVVKPERWEKEKKKFKDPWIIFIASEINNRGLFTFGNKEKTLEDFCSELIPEQTQTLGCVFLCAIDFFKKYTPCSKKETKHFPPWIVEEIISDHTELKVTLSLFFDMLYTLVFEEYSIRESCNKLEYLSINTRIRITETYNFSSIDNEYLIKKKKVDSLQKGVYLNFRPEKILKRAAYFCNFQKRKFSSKNTEYVTLFKKFSEMPFKKAISFYNASPYSCSFRDSMNILERIDKSCHPWLYIASISVLNNQIVIEDENKTNQTTQLSFSMMFDLITDKVGFLTCCILFQQPYQLSRNFEKSSRSEYKSSPNNHLLDTKVTKELYECAEIVIINDVTIVEEDKKFFLECFFDKLNRERCSLQRAFYETEKAYKGSRFPMKMICRPIDYYFEKSVQRFFFEDRNISSVINQRVKEETNLLKACNQLDPNFLKYFQGINTFGVNSTIESGRSLLLTALMRDLFEIARILLNYEDINVNTIDPMSGNTPLHIACAKFRVSLVKLLIERGAAVTQLNFKGHSPIFYVYKFSRNFKPNDEESKKKVEEICSILLLHGANHKEEKLSKEKSKGVDIEKMWKNREENYLKWLEEVYNKVYPKKFFFQWDASLVIPNRFAWDDIVANLEGKQKKLRSFNRKILYLNCNSRIDSSVMGREHLRYQEFEFNKIKEFSENECVKKFVNIDFCFTLQELKERLIKNKYWMIYFAGHATPDGFYMLDSKRDSNQYVPYSSLFDIFASNNSDYSFTNTKNNNIKCVVFNACSTGEINAVRAFSRNRNVDYIIATQKVITDSEGANFMFHFIKNLFVNEESIVSSFLSTITYSNLPFTLVRLQESLKSYEGDFFPKEIYFDKYPEDNSHSDNYIFGKKQRFFQLKDN